MIGLVTLIIGLTLGGGPGYARKQMRDQQRTDALSEMRNDVERFYAAQRRLPNESEYQQRVEANTYARSRFGENPIWNELLSAYRRSGPDTYELCASFETSTEAQGGYQPQGNEEYPNFWIHPGMRTCFPVRISSPLRTEAELWRQQAASSTQP